MNENSLPRRSVLGTVAGSITALAGCTDSTQPVDSESPFQDVAVEKSTVVVILSSKNGIERVNLIDPTGERIGSSEVVNGETRLEFDLGMSYTPGTFNIVGEPEGETSLDIRPDVEIQEVGVGVNHMDRMPDDLENTQDQEALVVVENLGNGLLNLLALTFGGDVPNPTKNVQPDGSRSGIFDEKEGQGEREQVPLPGKESVTIFSSTLPFSFDAEGEECDSMPDEGEFSVRTYSSVKQEPYTTNFGIHYSSTEDGGDCDISIEDNRE